MTLDEINAAIAALSATLDARRDAHAAVVGERWAGSFSDVYATAEERTELARLQLLRAAAEPTTAEIRARVAARRAARRSELDRSRDLSYAVSIRA